MKRIGILTGHSKATARAGTRLKDSLRDAELGQVEIVTAVLQLARLVSRLRSSQNEASDDGEDLVGGLDPHEALGVRVGGGDIQADQVVEHTGDVNLAEEWLALVPIEGVVATRGWALSSPTGWRYFRAASPNSGRNRWTQR